MIDANELKAKLKHYYENFVDLEGVQTISCERQAPNRKTYQKFYFDYSGNSENLENIRAFTRKLLAEEYYEHPGSIKWNYYLAFLTEVRSKISPDVIHKVEADDDYARKFVIQLDSLDAWLDNIYPKIETKQEAPEENLAQVWTTRLQEAFVGFVANPPVKISDGVRYILEQEDIPLEAFKDPAERMGDSDLSLGEIKGLKLIQYREYPKIQSPIEFGRVNLFYGVNGTGKTSLLEAIEYFLTGRTSRSRTDNMEQHSLQMNFASRGWMNFEYNYELFRGRDRLWYKSDQARSGSNLNDNFNRFNLYNSDAALRLENGGEEQLEDAFRDIALGETVSFLRSQAKKYLERLTPELKSLNREHDELKGRKMRLDKEMKGYAVPPILPIGAFETARKMFDQIFERRSFPDSVDGDLSSIQAHVSQSIAFVRNLIEDLSWIPSFSLSSISQHGKNIDETAKALKKKSDQISIQKENLGSVSLENKNIYNQIECLKAILPYFEFDSANEIDGLQDNIAKTQAYLDSVRDTSSIYVSYRNSLLESQLLEVHGDETLVSLVKLFKAELSQLEKSIEKASYQIEEWESELTAIQNIYSKVQAEVIFLLETTENISQCPACGNKYNDVNDLMQRIRENRFVSEKSGVLLNLRNTMKTETLRRDKLADFVCYLRAIESTVDTLPNPIGLGNAVRLILPLIDSQLQKAFEREEELEGLKRLMSGLQSAGLSESGFSRLSRELETLTGIKTSEASYDSVLKFLNDLNRDESKLTLELIKIQGGIEQLEAQRREMITEYDPAILGSDTQDIINTRQTTVKRKLSEIQKSFVFSLKSDIDIQSLKTSLDSLMATLTTVSEEKKDAALAKQRIDDIATEDADLKGAIERLNALVQRVTRKTEAIKEIAEGTDEDNYLNDFLNRNEEQIFKIFRAIHRPSEFKRIQVRDGMVTLGRISGQSDGDGLNKISSGQRSALALSIFLALNRKIEDAPPFLMFDDPIAHTDDLNVLSFLDYLRELVLQPNNGRQIFFATANDNLAFLFEKKFEFLGNEDFKRFHLTRDN